MKSTIGKFIIILGSIILFSSGIGRDDVPLSKYFHFAKNPVFDCVGEIYFKNEFSASCVLIGKKHIISAAHNFYFESDSLVFDSIYDQKLKKWFYGKHPFTSELASSKLFSIKIAGKSYKVRKINIYSEYFDAKIIRDEFGPHVTEGFYKDIAIAALETEVLNVKPAIIFEGNNELGKRAIISGFGEVEKASDYNSENTNYIRRKMAGENMIDSFGNFKVDNEFAAITTDFDNPKSTCCSSSGSSKSLPLEWYGNTGDCGCGLFINDNNVWKLAGICSSEDSQYESITFGNKYGKYYGFTDLFQRVSAYKIWINKILTEM
ncbi:MAG: hypothetical protein ACOYMA_17355 [Bacteroidia bacterium]